jgi:hypothetical protein
MINTAVLNPIINQIKNLNPMPAFVVFGGDGAYRGYYHDDNVTFYTFQTFKDLFAPLTSAGIKLYTAIGNHELYDQHGGTLKLANQTEYQQVFSDNPGNGPAGYERLVYSFTSPGGSAFFACGHSHLYSRKFIDRSVPPSPRPIRPGRPGKTAWCSCSTAPAARRWTPAPAPRMPPGMSTIRPASITSAWWIFITPCSL